MEQQKINSLYQEIIENIKSGKTLSNILPSVLMLAIHLKNEDLRKWTELELNSYYNTNKALTDDVVVPEYRAVAGQYYDMYRRPLIISDPDLSYLNEYRLRQSITELEQLAGSDKIISIQDSQSLEIISKAFKVNLQYFSFGSSSINGIIDSIKTILINKLIENEPLIEKNIDPAVSHTATFNTLYRLHPMVQSTASKLYLDGHYRQAILDTYIMIVNAVKTKSGCHNIDGVSLMQTVFSVKDPIVKLSENNDEQLGFMWLFTGAAMGVRNALAHTLSHEKDSQRALEWLSFASILMRLLDDAVVLKKKP